MHLDVFKSFITLFYVKIGKEAGKNQPENKPIKRDPEVVPKKVK